MIKVLGTVNDKQVQDMLEHITKLKVQHTDPFLCPACHYVSTAKHENCPL